MNSTSTAASDLMAILLPASLLLAPAITGLLRTRPPTKPRRRGDPANRRPVFGADWQAPDA